jgi:hypothetical protein
MTKLHQKVDDAVKEFADAIVEAATKRDPEVGLVCECETTTSDDGKYHASICDIQTDTGFVTIFPDFQEEAAKASILNRGLIRAMELEGFDDETINDSPVYSTLMPLTKDSLDILALVLTEDVGLQHQKNIEE